MGIDISVYKGEENSAEQGPMTSLAIHALRNERFRDIVMSPNTNLASQYAFTVGPQRLRRTGTLSSET
ncbi:hypothetical protein JMJ77_0003066 [Colletotrichum scovillei]|uniref:Uncharacterized protein n=1 Tax=Colletotrichum scovillei TaxID=1209932 RepID=A0A9P7U7N1_9PEZI|nr:hypothetical protein JMJ77_0003066 [Colletotrichum scovillei]KAG7062807.1 hypothetical protein JMJ76_0009650 [Colletotrichum scovillei]